MTPTQLAIDQLAIEATNLFNTLVEQELVAFDALPSAVRESPNGSFYEETLAKIAKLVLRLERAAEI